MKKELLVGIITTVVGGIILMIIEPSRKFVIILIMKLIYFFRMFFSFIWKFLIGNHEINGFLIVFSVILWILFLIIIFMTIKENLSNKKHQTYNDYKDDIFYGLTWRWHWDNMNISNLWCFCPTCEFELSYRNEQVYLDVFRSTQKVVFTCEHCQREYPFIGYDKDYFVNVIGREIRRKIRISEKPDKQKASHASKLSP